MALPVGRIRRSRHPAQCPVALALTGPTNGTSRRPDKAKPPSGAMPGDAGAYRAYKWYFP
ncbi:hypothetical protein ACY19T_17790 [Citrobacter koseri]|uniref:hypothetical protein n=1 Tax=Citrobacter koseri TaxID=545 RepID=UPI0035254D9A